MQTESTTGAPTSAADQDALVRLGGWLFKQRSWLPIPMVVALLVIPAPARDPIAFASGMALVAIGELVRLWAVHHIGVISRTRSERLGPLISTGPFGHVRNPLYLGNIALWLGFTVSAGLVWLAPVFLVVLALEYQAIVRWEEGLLLARLGDSYRAYLGRVRRWLPALSSATTEEITGAYSWRATLFSERSTLIAIAVGYALLWLKAR